MWLDKLDLEDNTLDSSEVYRVGEESKAGGLGVKLVDVDGETLSLYRCAWCGNPSASLRKCMHCRYTLITCGFLTVYNAGSGCGKVRYCDTNCQKMGWNSHKKACKKT